MDGQTPPNRKRSRARRLARALAVLLTLGCALVAAAPWLLSTTAGRNAALQRVNRVLAPSRVGARGLSVSWFGAIRAEGLTLRDGKGKLLIDARRAVTDRGLFALLRSPSRLGVITLDGAAVDIERRPDGSIDLVDALSPPRPPAAPAAAPRPSPSQSRGGVAVTLRVTRGSLRLATPELAEPLTAGAFELEVTDPAAAGKPLAWRVRLAEPPGGTGTETLGVDGDYDLHAAPGTDPALNLAVKGVRWPLAVAGPGFVARGRLDGALKAARGAGGWATSGDARLTDVTASGPALNGDRPAFDTLSATWDVAQGAGGWSVKTANLVGPFGTLGASGSFAGADAAEGRAEARVDLAALARQLPHTLRLREGLTLERGSAKLLVQVSTRGDARTTSVEATVSDLAARDPSHAFTLRDPAALTARATRTRTGFTLDAFSVKTAFLDLTGSGDPDRGVKLSGTLDLGGLESHLKDVIDFGGVRLAGRGRMVADFRKTGSAYVARYAAELKGLNLAGLTTRPIARDAVRFDAAVSGPADASGVPTGWEALRVNAVGGPDKLAVSARRRDGWTTATGSGSLPVAVSGRDGRADVAAAGRWKPGADGGAGRVEFEELRATLRPADPALAAAGTVAVAVKGFVDLDADGLSLAPLPLAAGLPNTVAVGPEGLVVSGLRRTPMPGKAAKGVLVGDLAAVERALFVWAGRAPGGYAGSARLQVGVGPGKGRQNLGLVLTVPDLTRPAADGKARVPEGPLNIAFGGGYVPAADRLEFDALSVVTRYGKLDGKGSVTDPAGRRVSDLAGTIAPAWEAVSALAAASVEPNLKLTGHPRAFRLAGPLSGGSLAAVLRGLDAELGVDLTSADAFGLKLGPAPVVVRCKGGAVSVDPIRTTLNNGRVTLLPGLTVDDARGVAVTLAKGSTIEGAEINDEVSRRLLTYVAPVLDKATHVNGTVSASVDRAEFPLTGPPDRRVNLLGQLAFQNVVFAPGPFAAEVLALTGQPDSPGLRLHQPVQLAVADGRVFQKGLEIPVRKDAKVALEGSVGFDQTLDLRASVPVSGAMLGVRSADLDRVVSGRSVVVPIDGTVSRPRVNKHALQVALRELSRSVFKRELSGRASDLLNQLAPPPEAGPGPGPASGVGGAGAGAGGAGGGLPPDVKDLGDALLRRLRPGTRGNR